MLFQWASTIKIQLSILVWYKADIIISSKVARHDKAEKLLIFYVIVKQHSLTFCH